ncbi:MAG: protein kinase [Acidobacteria bacterium]|nr:protein kinase [Acidobacteriota bacterium]
MPDLKLEHSLVDGRYEVYERLTRGSYAEIFVAYDRAVSRAPVVIKALNTSLQGTPDPDLERTLVENFQNEAIALDAVRHPHVILRLGHGTASDLREVPFHYLVLEYMPGGDLLELCRHRPDRALPLDEALFYFHQVCEALAFAHSKGIIHRDLKPNNFLLSADKRTLKVADFGVAKITTGESTEITRVGADVYAPPEHNPNEDTGELQKLTTAADVYSLAKSFYTVVCGRAPSQFRCDPITSLPPSLAGKPWGTALLNVLQKATDDDPKARFATVAEFWHELAQVAALNPTVNLEELLDEETIVKPRQKFDTGAFPAKPVQPDFDPTPATSQLQEVVSSALPVQAEATTPNLEAKATEPAVAQPAATLPKAEPSPAAPVRNERPGKIFIELQPQKVTPIQPAPAPASVKPAQSPVVAKPGQGKAPAKAAAKQPPKIASRFSEKIRRRVFIAFMGAAFIGLLVSIFNIFKGGQVGSPREVEVVTVSLNVREAPGRKVLGTVAQGTRHRVVSVNEQGWMLIQVGQWETLKQGTPVDANQGWVDGNPEFVRVVSRRWW